MEDNGNDAIYHVMGKSKREAKNHLRRMKNIYHKPFEMIVIEEDGEEIPHNINDEHCIPIRVRIRDGRVVSYMNK